MVKKDAEIKFRVDGQTALAAKAKAEKLDVPLSLILRQLLREWIKDDPSDDQERQNPLEE